MALLILLGLGVSAHAEQDGSWGCRAKPNGGWDCNWSGQGEPPEPVRQLPKAANQPLVPVSPAPIESESSPVEVDAIPSLAPVTGQVYSAPQAETSPDKIPSEPQPNGESKLPVAAANVTERAESKGGFSSSIDTVKGLIGADEGESGSGSSIAASSRASAPPELQDLQPAVLPPEAQSSGLAAPVVQARPELPAEFEVPVAQPQEQSQSPRQGQSTGFAPWATLKRWVGMDSSGGQTEVQLSDTPAPVVEGSKPFSAEQSSPSVKVSKPVASAPAVIKPAPATSPSIRFKPLPGDERKIHVVQIVSASQQEGLQALIKEFGLDAKAWIFQEQRNGAPWYSLFYGRYASLDEALDAMQALPQAVQQRGPWVRKVEISP